MRVLDLTSLPHRDVDSQGSHGLSMGAFVVTADAAPVSVSLPPGGVIGRHPAAGTQQLVVPRGSASVPGSSGDPVTIGPG